MSRTRAPGRLRDLLDAGASVFISQGYRGARIEDVAARAGVSVGTVHLYARTKEALFDLVMRDALYDKTVMDEPLPYALADNDFIGRIWHRLNAAADFSVLRNVSINVPPQGVIAEFEEIVRELYRWLMRYHVAIKLIERCAREWPELAALYYQQFRREGLDRLATYLEWRGAQGSLRVTADAAIAARVVLETIAFFALHRHSAPDSQMENERAELVVVDMLSHSLRVR